MGLRAEIAGGEEGSERSEGCQGSEAAGEADLVSALRAGDEAAFEELVERHHASMVRIARAFVRETTLAEEVAQETWLAVLRGLARFEGRCSLRTWLFRILANRARTAARREARTTTFTDAVGDSPDGPEQLFDPAAFRHPLAEGHWTSPLRTWAASPEELMLNEEARELLDAAVEQLPPNQRAVVTLRDVEGWDAEEVCNALGFSGVHQRVLLHRARTKVRRALAAYFERGES